MEWEYVWWFLLALAIVIALDHLGDIAKELKRIANALERDKD
jgi:hypothetical protein